MSEDYAIVLVIIYTFSIVIMVAYTIYKINTAESYLLVIAIPVSVLALTSYLKNNYRIKNSSE
jgi:hypothetical protein